MSSVVEPSKMCEVDFPVTVSVTVTNLGVQTGSMYPGSCTEEEQQQWETPNLDQCTPPVDHSLSMDVKFGKYLFIQCDDCYARFQFSFTVGCARG